MTTDQGRTHFAEIAHTSKVQANGQLLEFMQEGCPPAARVDHGLTPLVPGVTLGRHRRNVLLEEVVRRVQIRTVSVWINSVQLSKPASRASVRLIPSTCLSVRQRSVTSSLLAHAFAGRCLIAHLP